MDMYAEGQLTVTEMIMIDNNTNDRTIIHI